MWELDFIPMLHSHILAIIWNSIS